MLELSAAFMLLTFVVFVGYRLFAASIRNQVETLVASLRSDGL